NEENKSVVGINKSQIQFKESVWYLNEQSEKNNNQIIFNKEINDFDIDNLTLSHNNQIVRLDGSMKGANYKDLALEFNNVELDKITPDVTNLTFAGLINGYVSFTQEND